MRLNSVKSTVTETRAVRKLILFLLILLSTPNYADEKNPFIGSWYFLSGEYTDKEGNTTRLNNENFKALRTMSDDSFAIVNMELGSFKGWLQGTYKMTDGKIIESIEKGSGGDLIGKELHFKYSFNGQTCTFEGQEGNIYIKEVWQKLN